MMATSGGKWIGWAGGILVGTLICVFLLRPQGGQAAGNPLAPRIDSTGPYIILASEAASHDYEEALAEARKLHPDAIEGVFSPDDLDGARALLSEHEPYYAMVFLLPEELDVNLGWRWLRLTAEIDDDPFVDVRTGFITGETPKAAADFLRRIRSAVEGDVVLPGAVSDDLGPNMMVPKTAWQEMPGSFFLPVFADRFALHTVSHGTEGFTKERLDCLDGAGIVHFGGHGYPDRIVDALNGPYVRRIGLAPCVVFNGACYTGVTSRWFDMGGTLTEKRVKAKESFCLGLLTNKVVGYLAALHPDHGIPVYQELEFLATTGASLGDIIKYTHDGVVLGAGGKLPDLTPLETGMSLSGWTPSDIMLKGTAARVLFGDPSFLLMEAFTPPPFAVTVRTEGEGLLVTATLRNDRLKSTYTDTFHADLSSDPNLFNDRALISCDLPPGWTEVRDIEVVKVEAGGRSVPHRLLAFAVEADRDVRRLHVQVDLPTTGYMTSAFRCEGAAVELRVQR